MCPLTLLVEVQCEMLFAGKLGMPVRMCIGKALRGVMYEN